jgi:TRAP-type transport system small permease protein
MAALVVMMLVTIVDVTMRMLLNDLVLGSVELVELALVAVVFLALPETFVRDEQITVDLVDQLVRDKALRRLRSGAAIVTALFLGALAWRTVPPALDTLEIGDLTSDLQLSLFWYWLPIVTGAVVAAVIAVVLAWRRLATAGAGEL